MKATKLILLSASIFTSGCVNSPRIPELTSNHPASVDGREGSVDVPSIAPNKVTPSDTEKPTNPRKVDSQGMSHDMKGMSHMKMKETE